MALPGPSLATAAHHWTSMSQGYSSSDDTHAMVARIAPAIFELLGDGLPRSRHDIVAALAGQHTRDEVVRALMRLAVTGRLVETERKYRLPPEASRARAEPRTRTDIRDTGQASRRRRDQRKEIRCGASEGSAAARSC